MFGEVVIAQQSSVETETIFGFELTYLVRRKLKCTLGHYG
jgi:hypothetical protein